MILQIYLFNIKKHIARRQHNLFVGYLHFTDNLVFPFLLLLNLSIFFNYESSFLTNTSMNYATVSILKYIPVQTT